MLHQRLSVWSSFISIIIISERCQNIFQDIWAVSGSAVYIWPSKTVSRLTSSQICSWLSPLIWSFISPNKRLAPFGKLVLYKSSFYYNSLRGSLRRLEFLLWGTYFPVDRVLYKSGRQNYKSLICKSSVSRQVIVFCVHLGCFTTFWIFQLATLVFAQRRPNVLSWEEKPQTRKTLQSGRNWKSTFEVLSEARFILPANANAKWILTSQIRTDNSQQLNSALLPCE